MAKKYLITSALPYVNNLPHLGTMVCVVSADVYTRFLRLKKENVISVLGTDEHGTTTETKALELGITAKECCDRFFATHKELYDWFECAFDCFGRTSSKENAEVTLDIFTKLKENGFILEKDVEQMYCEQCKKFLADRFIIGTCPYCSFDDAKGDQCDKCNKLLEPHELINPRCKVCGTTPVKKSTKHLYIDLPKLTPKLTDWMLTVRDSWSENAVTTTEAWMKEGLQPRAITRDLSWGIPVPGLPGKVFYSWFDAPIGYIGIVKECRKDWQDWWKPLAEKDVELVQFMGKDNIPFHTILFPAFLLGTKENYTLLKRLSVNEFLNYEDGKFSKSRNVGVFADSARETNIPASVWRYYLITNRPEKADTVFSWNDFGEKLNNELVANLGNLCYRLLFFVEKNYQGKVPALPTTEDGSLPEKPAGDEIIASITILLESIELRAALKEVMRLAKLGNQYFQDHSPWKLTDAKEGSFTRKECDSVIVHLLNLVKDISIVASPFLPGLAKQLQQQLNMNDLSWDDLGKPLPAGHKLGKPFLLLKKVEPEQLDAFRKRFSGTQQEVVQTPVEQRIGLDLRVAKILAVDNHPKADKLYVLQLDLGSEKRQLVAGLRQHYAKEDLLGKNLIIVANLKPTTLRGVESQGMLLAADDGKEIGILTIDAAPGSVVDIGKNAAEQITYEEFSTFSLEAKEGKAYCNDVMMTVNGKNVLIEKVTDGKIR
ncbi:MAG: methionine--tRNA ligase [archaeon]